MTSLAEVSPRKEKQEVNNPENQIELPRLGRRSQEPCSALGSQNLEQHKGGWHPYCDQKPAISTPQSSVRIELSVGEWITKYFSVICGRVRHSRQENLSSHSPPLSLPGFCARWVPSIFGNHSQSWPFLECWVGQDTPAQEP